MKIAGILALIFAAILGVWSVVDYVENEQQAEQQARMRADEIDHESRELQDNTAVEGDKLDAENAELEHRPNPNAAKQAKDEARQEADEMQDKLDPILKQEYALLGGGYNVEKAEQLDGIIGIVAVGSLIAGIALISKGRQASRSS